MNLVPATVEGGRLHLPFVACELPPDLRAAVGGRQLLVVGLRPEAFEDGTRADASQASPGATFAARVDVAEWLGNEQYAYVPYDAPSGGGRLSELARELDAERLGSQLVVAVDPRRPARSRRRARAARRSATDAPVRPRVRRGPGAGATRTCGLTPARRSRGVTVRRCVPAWEPADDDSPVRSSSSSAVTTAATATGCPVKSTSPAASVKSETSRCLDGLEVPRREGPARRRPRRAQWCGGRMRVLATIEYPRVVRRILTRGGDRPRRPRDARRRRALARRRGHADRGGRRAARDQPLRHRSRTRRPRPGADRILRCADRPEPCSAAGYAPRRAWCPRRTGSRAAATITASRWAPACPGAPRGCVYRPAGSDAARHRRVHGESAGPRLACCAARS